MKGYSNRVEALLILLIFTACFICIKEIVAIQSRDYRRVPKTDENLMFSEQMEAWGNEVSDAIEGLERSTSDNIK